MAETNFKISEQSSVENVLERELNSEKTNELKEVNSLVENANISSDPFEIIAEIDRAVEKAFHQKGSEESSGHNVVDEQQNEEENVESGTPENSFVYKCIFCENILNFNDQPKLLECLHNVCGSCVNNNKICEQNENVGEKINQTALITCSTCSLTSQVDRIIDNQFLLELSNHEETHSKNTDIKCSSCSDDAFAVSWCADCLEFICESCVQAHQRLKITKDHTIKSKEEGLLENQASSNLTTSQTVMCSKHPHEKLSLFCESCDKLTCRDCQLIEHRDHKYKFTHEIASETRKFISHLLKDVSYKRVLLDSAMKVIADRQLLISDKKAAIVQEITQMVVKLTNTINTRGKELISKLNEVCEQKQKTLQEKKIALDQLSKITDHCIEFTEHALESGSDMALLFSKKQVTNHLQRIKCKRADIPNPEIPVRIHLALDKVPELIKVISTIGQIVVDGRVYPLSPASPATIAAMPPHGSPSPNQPRPPQQQSPQAQPHIQPQPPHYQQPQITFQHPRMLPPPYGQQQQQQQQQQQLLQQQQPQQQHYQQTSQNVQQSLNQKSPSQLPMVLQQHLQHNFMQKLPLPRNAIPMQRSFLSMNRLPNPGVNHQQQQVSSSTHPQGLMQERGSLRGLLQPANTHNSNTVYIQTGPNQYRAVQPQFAQQYQNRYNNQQQIRHQGVQGGSIRLVTTNNVPRNFQAKVNVQNQNYLPQPVGTAKWHIPQTSDPTVGGAYTVSVMRNQSAPQNDDNFKITLKSQTIGINMDGKPPAVSSTIPKTPSPNGVQGSKSDTERNLDKFCQDSVNDLMATIAKLDSNGVQVLAEGNIKTGSSPHVDSSTDENSAVGVSAKSKAPIIDVGKDDPNEDWCAVCMDGGELVCCDKCPKVFHQFCHIPNLSVEENDTWQCLLCTNLANLAPGEFKEGELDVKHRKIVERIVLELYCQYEPSLPFRELIGLENTEYHSIIKKPIALDTIRHKLDWNASNHYTNIDDFIKDVRLMFKNAYTFNDESTQVYQDAKTLEFFFNEQLEKFLPAYAYDELIPPASKKIKRMISE